MHAIITAGRPTFFRSARFRESPAFSRIMISAIWRSSDEIERMEESSTFSTYGPSRIPVISIPIIRGSFSLWQIAASERPIRKIKASEVNIVIISSFIRRKADAPCDHSYHRSHQLNKRFGMIPGRHSFPFLLLKV